ncbi:uncharacterized protein LOC124282077 isoform X2 [Haliotis rubra]|uniref:uncharacterized protein LOC124282077 isoform X2 n=1 Tax=Haliotis rubra TaxID=36100 RepID=UPI001EE52072|nr:uncharacterized protein LOC124282077 isoform X2 [Haliotis rubra]
MAFLPKNRYSTGGNTDRTTASKNMAKPLIITIGILLILMGTGTEACSCVGCSPSPPIFCVIMWTVVIGLPLLLLLVGIAVYCCRRRRRKRNCKALDHAELHPSHKDGNENYM